VAVTHTLSNTHSSAPPYPAPLCVYAGVIAEPFTCLTDLTADDTWLIVCSDGLLENEERGGGGGLRQAGLHSTGHTGSQLASQHNNGAGRGRAGPGRGQGCCVGCCRLGARREKLPSLLLLHSWETDQLVLVWVWVWVSRLLWTSRPSQHRIAAVSSVLAAGPPRRPPQPGRCPALVPACACSNEDVVSICNKLASKSCDDIAAELSAQAVAKGSTDDVTTLVRECLNAVLCCAVPSCLAQMVCRGCLPRRYICSGEGLHREKARAGWVAEPLVTAFCQGSLAQTWQGLL
jgi:hypothetical protein